MVAYYLLSMVSRAFSSMPGLASGIALQIRNGEIKKYLIQPIDMIEIPAAQPRRPQAGVLLRGDAAVRLRVLPLPGLFLDGLAGVGRAGLLLATLLMGFLLGFFLEASIGLIGFWFLEVSSLLFVYMLFSFFLSGHMFPLDMLPEPWGRMVDMLPLKYLAYFPAAVFLGKVPRDEMVRGLVDRGGLGLVLPGAARVAYRRGVRRYSGFGG